MSIDELFREVKNIEGVKGAFKEALKDMERRIAALEARAPMTDDEYARANMARPIPRGPGRPPAPKEAA